ncbi:MAG: ATPases of the AAA+ class [uncultured Thiotrichaceae bacterium]|uniref:ATPases of the AAA+ class n=1 Tax=uncultured Thiotrichaceae bacterium TaxID=298394 RepID=A0A6S6T777_9GAMM|nr:MAG: ATPases of the AAA+ class [uncultured Thiotrichaceae bacterium]
MHLSADQFLQWEHKSITLLGMSGVGKTFLSTLLRNHDWFHFSGDYRIGTRYLNEPILDNIKLQAMQVPFLRDLLRSDSIFIENNITVDHLKPVSSFLGKMGNPDLEGLPLVEFKRRQALHREAEIAAMRDVPSFIQKAHDIYGFNHFINDAGGSVCELDEPSLLDELAENTIVLYIKATEQDEKMLIERAKYSPKPMYYREQLLDQLTNEYLTEKNLEYTTLIEPDDFVRWSFPKLFYSRIPRYDAIAGEYGYTISTTELFKVKTEQDFIDLVVKAINRKEKG